MPTGDGHCAACGYWHAPGHCIGLLNPAVMIDEPPIPWAEFKRKQLIDRAVARRKANVILPAGRHDRGWPREATRPSAGG